MSPSSSESASTPPRTPPPFFSLLKWVFYFWQLNLVVPYMHFPQHLNWPGGGEVQLVLRMPSRNLIQNPCRTNVHERGQDVLARRRSDAWDNHLQKKKKRTKFSRACHLQKNNPSTATNTSTGRFPTRKHASTLCELRRRETVAIRAACVDCVCCAFSFLPTFFRAFHFDAHFVDNSRVEVLLY